MNKTSQAAYTLVEVLMTCAILTFVMESVYTTLWVGQKTWVNYSENVLLKQNLRRALISMANELRAATGIFIVKDEHDNNLTLSFTSPSDGAVAYHWSPAGKDANKIFRINYNNSRVLAGDITYLSLEQPLDNEIIIDAAVGRDKRFELKEKIALRLKTSLFSS